MIWIIGNAAIDDFVFENPNSERQVYPCYRSATISTSQFLGVQGIDADNDNHQKCKQSHGNQE